MQRCLPLSWLQLPRFFVSLALLALLALFALFAMFALFALFALLPGPMISTHMRMRLKKMILWMKKEEPG